MPSGQIHDSISNQYLEQFNKSISISVMSKLRKFPMLQELGYNGQLSHLKESFHGLKEFNVHMDMYSNTNIILKIAWKVIKSLAPKNPFLELKLFFGNALGKVGNLFKSIHNFDKVFAVNPDELLDPDKISSKVSEATTRDAIYGDQSHGMDWTAVPGRGTG